MEIQRETCLWFQECCKQDAMVAFEELIERGLLSPAALVHLETYSPQPIFAAEVELEALPAVRMVRALDVLAALIECGGLEQAQAELRDMAGAGLVAAPARKEAVH